MEPQRVRPLVESDVDCVLHSAGGCRAHPDSDSRRNVGADYRLGASLIELKLLDEEGLSKPERREKIASLFRRHHPDRPVIVLDRATLPPNDQRLFDRIIETPIKSAVAKAKNQLKQSRAEHPEMKCSVLMIVNNGYATLSHAELRAIVAHRVRNDSREIDALVVAGVYYHSDGFDSRIEWAMEYIPINLDRQFLEYDRLHEAWGKFADKFMTEMVLGRTKPPLTKGHVVDHCFDVGGVRYIRPAPAIGEASDFYVNGRPRIDSSGKSACPPVGFTIPKVSRSEWEQFKVHFGRESPLCDSYESWQREEQRAEKQGQLLRPTVHVSITFADWKTWCESMESSSDGGSVAKYANYLFCEKLQKLLFAAKELDFCVVLPSRYILATTEVIGQDCANDVSTLSFIKCLPSCDVQVFPIAKNLRIRHEHALALAAAYAVRDDVELGVWST